MLSRVEIALTAVCVALTGLIFNTSYKNQNSFANAEFSRLTEDSAQVLRTRMQTFVQTMKGAGAFISSSDEVTALDFRNYINAINIVDLMPGVTGVGLIVEVPDAEIGEFVASVRSDNRPEFQLRRLSDNPLHYIIKFMEPEATNAEALGLDVTFAPDRAAVLETARETGEPRLTAPFELVQAEGSLAGFAIIIPIFTDPSNTAAQGAFLGWINAAFVASDIVAELTPAQQDSYRLRVFDGPSPAAGTLLFDENAEGDPAGKFSASYEIDQFNRVWTMQFVSTPRFELAMRSYQPLAFLIGGLSLTAFLISVLHTIRKRDESLTEIANLRTRQIEAREQENRSIVENEVTSVFLVNHHDEILFANHAAQKCFGFTEAEMKNVSFASIARGIDDADQNHNAIGTTKDGEVLELDLQRNDWLSGHGQLRSTIILRDLTAQNLAQRELSRSKVLFDLALKGSEIGVFELNLATGTSEVSNTWCRIMGYEDGCNAMDTQQDFLSRIHPDDVGILKRADADCIAGRTERSIAEYRLKTRNGDWCWMRSDAVVAERDAQGAAVRLIGTQSDVTTLRRDRDALEASEKQFRQVVENAPIGMALMDHEGKFLGVNSAFARLAGQEEAKLISSGKLSDLLPYEDRKALYTAISRIIAGGKITVYTGEHRILCAKGEERWGLLNVSWSLTPNEGSAIYIAQVIDITAQKKLAATKDEFVSTVSHELRTPLTSIKGALGLLSASKGISLTKPQARLIDIASSNADRLTAIVNDILDLEKISSGEVTFDFADIDLSQIVTATINDMSPFAAAHNARLQAALPDRPMRVTADLRRTKQVLANLISNACKYSDPDSDVMVKVERIGDKAIVYVQNVGPGVPESFRPRIFHAFSQADSSDTRAKGGTGLGLNITRQIVLRQGGKIGFESIPDSVTIFWFTMPLSAIPVQAMPQMPKVVSVAKTSKLSVLHVEGDCDFAEVISGALADFAAVNHAKSLLEARQIISNTRLDLIILDWSMPDGDSGQLFDLIAEFQPGARIIALSADGERQTDKRLYASMIKGRTGISDIVAAVNECLSLAS